MKTGAKDGQGNPISVGCLVRIEANTDKFRVTARTLHPVVSQGVKETFCKVRSSEERSDELGMGGLRE